MNDFENFIKCYNNGILKFRFPMLPSMNEAFLIYSEDNWETFTETRMQPDNELKFYNLDLKTESKNICFRFRYSLSHTGNTEYYEDNNQNNFYLKNSRLFIQELNNPQKTFSKIIYEGKNILFTDSCGNSFIIFKFDNIFYFQSILENFSEFLYIDSNEKKETSVIKKIKDKVTWDTDIYNRNISPELREVIRNTLKENRLGLGIVNTTGLISGSFFLMYFFTNLSLDYIIDNRNLYWKE